MSAPPNGRPAHVSPHVGRAELSTTTMNHHASTPLTFESPDRRTGLDPMRGARVRSLNSYLCCVHCSASFSARTLSKCRLRCRT